MPEPVSATLGAAAIGAGGSIFSANKQASAAKKASQAQQQAAMQAANARIAGARDANERQQALFHQGGRVETDAAIKARQEAQGFANLGAAENFAGYERALDAQRPYAQAGQMGLAGQQALLGQSGFGAENSAINRILQGSEFQNQSRLGQEAILANASATGGLRGGNVQGALGQFQGSILNNLVNQQYQRLTGQVGVGQQASSQMSQLYGLQGRGQEDRWDKAASATALMYDDHQDISRHKNLNQATAYGNMANAIGGAYGDMYDTQGQAQAAGIGGASDAWANSFSDVAQFAGQGLGAAYPQTPVTTPTMRPV